MNLKQTNAKALLSNVTTNYSHWLSFLLLLLVATAINPSFLRWNNIANLFIQGAVIGICAMGMSLVISAGMIDLSVGASVAFTAGLGISILNNTQSIFLCLIFCIFSGAAIGLINGILVTKGKIAPFIVTLATMSAFRSIINQIGQGGPFTVSSEMYDSFRMIAAGRILGIPNLMIFFILITALTYILMNKTKFGTYVYAIGSNQNAAGLSGINVNRVKTIVLVYAATP